MFEAVAKNLNIDRGTLRFLYEGSPVSDDQSPKMLELEDGDQIDCMIQQVGGNVDGDEKAEQKTISVVVKIANAPPLTLKVKDSTKMEKIFNAVAQQTGVSLPSFPSFLTLFHLGPVPTNKVSSLTNSISLLIVSKQDVMSVIFVSFMMVQKSKKKKQPRKWDWKMGMKLKQ